MTEELRTVTLDFHGLMDLCGVFSEDQFSGKWHHGIQPKGSYFDVIDNEDGTFLVRGTSESFAPLGPKYDEESDAGMPTHEGIGAMFANRKER
tara:strand:+ start:423 stop:701 length:279 start_codon:yes stop_codon:yes gene_type:complete